MTIDDIVDAMKYRYPCFIVAVAVPDGDGCDINTYIKGDFGVCIQLVEQIGDAIEKAVDKARDAEGEDR